MPEVLEFLQTNRVFFLATVDGDQPKARPLGFVMAYEGRIFFGVGDQKEVYRQMKANPKVEIVSVSPEGRWMRLHGSAVFDQRPEVFAEAVKILPVLKDMYGAPGGPQLGSFYLTNAEAVFHDMTGPVKTVKV